MARTGKLNPLAADLKKSAARNVHGSSVSAHLIKARQLVKL
jgi:hypothetical protein